MNGDDNRPSGDPAEERPSQQPDRLPGTERPLRPRSRVPVYLGLAGLVVLVAGLVLWLLMSAAGRGGPAVATSPRLAVDRDKIDFGQVPVNKRVTATFTLSNTGDRPLIIVGEPRVEVARGC